MSNDHEWLCAVNVEVRNDTVLPLRGHKSRIPRAKKSTRVNLGVVAMVTVCGVVSFTCTPEKNQNLEQGKLESTKLWLSDPNKDFKLLLGV
jgi:hypothetical protein